MVEKFIEENNKNKHKNEEQFSLEDLIDFSNSKNKEINDELDWIKKNFLDCKINFKDKLSQTLNVRKIDRSQSKRTLIKTELVNNDLQNLFLSFQNKNSFLDKYSFRSHELDDVLILLNKNTELNENDEDKISDFSNTTRIVINKIEI